MSSVRKPLLVAAIFAFCIAAAGTSHLTPSDVVPYVRPQRMVDAGGHKLNLYCTGRGSPAVILDAGEGGTMWDWHKVQPEIARFTQVCSFDRAGMGFSQGGPLPRDANAMVADLHALLHNAGIPAPYVLAAHSIAGLYAPLYADRYQHEVAGMVLVDPSFPNQTAALEAASPALKRMDSAGAAAFQFCYRAAVHGELGLAQGAQKYAMCGFPAHAAAMLKAQCAKNGPAFCELQRAQIAQIRRPVFWLDLASEDASGNARDSAEDLKAQRSFGAMPLIVLTAANDAGPAPFPPAQLNAIERVWTAGHDRLARLSSVGANFVVHHSGHYIQIDRPSVVTSAISEVVSQARIRL